MIYISAQPDGLYFIWQLELQIFNFRRVGIKDSQIHILIAYYGSLTEHAKIFKVKYPTIGIFFYPGISLYYRPSIRPMILEQHFRRHTWLSQETIFYHDCDILFRQLPDLKGEFDCLVSDTRSYTGPAYVNSKGDNLLRTMCAIVGIGKEEITEQNSGGAQYVLRNIHADFWGKVEQDCVAIYRYLSENQKGENPIQRWCADMWALQYNLLFFGHSVAIHSELSFAWATDHVSQYEKHNIFHNAGVTEPGKMFYKDSFKRTSPLDKDHQVNPEYCSSVYVQEIKAFQLSQRISN